jgi:hypothetical protein
MDLRRRFDEERALVELTRLHARQGENFGPEAVTGAIEHDRAIAPEIAAQLEWDDAAGAHAHRVQQVRGIMRAVTVVIPERPEEPVRAFLPVHRQPVKPGDIAHPWRPVGEVVAEPANLERVLAQYEQQIRSLVRRYRSLAPDSVRTMVEKIASEIDGDGVPPG